MVCSICVLEMIMGEWETFVTTLKVVVPMSGLLVAALLPAVVFALKPHSEIMWIITEAYGMIVKAEIQTLAEHLPPSVESKVEASVKREIKALQESLKSIEKTVLNL